MKRREFMSVAAGAGAGVLLTGTSANAMTAKMPPEKRGQIYKCVICSTIIEVIEPGIPSLVHCKKPMELLEEQTADYATEKHVPVITKVDGGYKVTVGSTLHPMTDEHYIQWIELICGDVVSQVYLKPGDAPEAIFHTGGCDCPVTAREHCNVHGLWKG